MLNRLKVSDWLLAPAIAAFVLFWSFALAGALATPPQQENKPVNSSSAHCATRECRQETNEKALTDYTGELAWFTGVLAVVSFLQGIFLWRADLASKRAFDASTEATKASQALAERRFMLQGLQTDISEKQKEIQRIQLLALHRPKLVVREVYWVDEKTAAIGFILVNQGVNSAVIQQSRFEFNRTDERPILPGADENDFKDMTPLPGGVARIVSVDAGSAHGLELAAFDLGYGETVTFHGVLIYGDEWNPARYRTVFKRVCAKGENIYRRTENPDDEYSD